MTFTPAELDRLADELADRLTSRLSDRPCGDVLLDVHQAAELLGCSVPTVERQTKNGRIPSTKIGRLRRYRRADLLTLGESEAGSVNDE